MKNIISKIVSLLFMFSAVAHAGDFNLNALSSKDLLSLAEAAPAGVPVPVLFAADAAADKSASLKEWTVMVYINGKNNLSEYGKKDLNEMETVGSTSKMNIVVELGRELSSATERYLVTKDKAPTRIGSEVLEYVYKSDMGDWKHLVNFAQWSKKKFPAKRYMLVIWNHGDGWKTTKGISYDDQTGNHISTPELGQAMKEIGKVDILAMDACLMQMAEVAYEVKDYADVIVASEETEPGDGYPYDTILNKMSRMTSRPTEDIAKNIVTQYGKYYSSNKKATQSALKTDKLRDLAFLLNDWAVTAMGLEDKKPLAEAVKAAESYAISEYKDLGHFLGLAAEKTGDPVLAEKGEKIRRLIAGELVIANSSLRANSNGISIYVTTKGTGEKYAQLAWAGTQWDEFLNSIKGIVQEPVLPQTGCVVPDAGAPLQELMDYLDCTENYLSTLN